MSKICIIYRSIVTINAFIFFVIGSILFFPISVLVIKLYTRNDDKRKKNTRILVKYAFKALLGYCQIFGMFKIKYINFNNVNNLQNSIIIANHPTLIDVLMVISKTNPNTISIVANKLTKSFMKNTIATLGYLSNNLNIEEIAEKTKFGENILLFPEGTRTKTNNKFVFHKGAAYLAYKQNKPIIPVYISCSIPEYMNNNFFSWKAPIKKPILTLEVGEPIYPHKIITNDKSDAVKIREINHFLENNYNHKMFDMIHKNRV